jgi:hypothetical protein
VYTVGQYFQHGWYLEAVMEWNATGFFGFQTSFYGFGDFWEVDNPDAFAFDQSVVNWGGGTAVVMQNNNHTFFAPTVETGTNRYGALSTPIDFTWWINDSPNGAVSFRFGSATDVYNAKECFGIESTSQYSITLNSFKVWQTTGAATPPTGGGGLRFMRL